MTQVPHAVTSSTFRTERFVSAPPHEVFAAFSRADRLARWWGPNGFSNTFEVFEFVPGGRWAFVMHGPEGTNYPNENVIQEIVADRRIVIRHASQPQFTLSVSLSACGEGTTVTWVQEFDDAEVAKRVRHIVEPANEQNLDRLTTVLQGETV